MTLSGFTKVMKQAFDNIRKEPDLGYAIVGRCITMGIRVIGTQTTILAIT